MATIKVKLRPSSVAGRVGTMILQRDIVQIVQQKVEMNFTAYTT